MSEHSTEPPVDSFQQRRALALAIDALEQTNNEAELVLGAHAIVDEYPAPLVIGALLKRLDTPSGQLRGGLARMATFLPAADIIYGLRAYAANRANPPQGRTTAAMMMERHLGQTVPLGVLSDLQNNEDAAVQSLREAVEEGAHDRQVLLDYVTQMQAHGEAIAFLVMQHLDALPAADRVNLLRVLAQDPRPTVARAALGRLDQITAHESALAVTAAARALYTLQPNLPAELATLAERTLRKLQFRGAGYAPPHEEIWRAFMGVPQPYGTFALWLERVTPEDDSGRNPFMLTLHLRDGLLASAYAMHQGTLRLSSVTTSSGKPGASNGSYFAVPIVSNRGSEEAWFVEVSANSARWLLRQVLHAEHAQRPPRMVRGDYLLYNDSIWDAPPIADEPILSALLAAQGDELLREQATTYARALMQMPALQQWDMLRAARVDLQNAVMRGMSAKDLANMILRQIEDSGMETDLLAKLQDGLRALAIWQHVDVDTGENVAKTGSMEISAGKTAALARSLAKWSIQENPLFLAMLSGGSKA